MDIRQDDLTHPAVIALLQEHLDEMALHSPPESIHALDLAALRHPDITFWSVWESAELIGCVAIKRLDDKHAELKSMRLSPGFRGKGRSKAMLQHVLRHAKNQQFAKISLETGSMQAFEPARKLYEQFGFSYCSPFADYCLDPHSVFMTLDISP